MTVLVSNRVLTIVCSDQARNGKTLLASFLADYLIHQGRDVSMFDLDHLGGGLASRFAGLAKVIDLSQTSSIMTLFDTIVSTPAHDYVLDVPHHQLDWLFSTIDEFNVVEAARKNGLVTNVLFFCDPTIASIARARKIKRKMANACFIIVRNESIRALNPNSNLVAAYKELCRPGYFVLPQMTRDTMACLADKAWTFTEFLDHINFIKKQKKHYTAYLFFYAMAQEFERLQFRLDIEEWKNSGSPSDLHEQMAES